MVNFLALRVGGLSPLKFQNVIFQNKPSLLRFANSCYSLNANNSKPRKFPELLYFPKFFRWVGMKFKLKYLQKAWDPEFSEGAFIYGSTQAICRVTQIIHRNQPDQLSNLLTDAAVKQLRMDMDRKLNHQQKRVILLTPDDIKLLVPIKVQLIKENQDQKRCLVMLKSLSMKWHQEDQNIKLVLIVIDTEFTREYNQHSKSEWFISLFNIVQCALIGGSPPVTPRGAFGSVVALVRPGLKSFLVPSSHNFLGGCLGHGQWNKEKQQKTILVSTQNNGDCKAHGFYWFGIDSVLNRSIAPVNN